MNSFRHRLIFAAIVVGTISLVACIPLPFTRQVRVAPSITGRYYSETGDKSASTILLTVNVNDSTCRSAAATSTVDSAGKFSFASVSQSTRWQPIFGDYIAGYRMCANAEGKVQSIHVSTWRWNTVPEQQSVTCQAWKPTESLGLRVDCHDNSRE